MSEPSTRSVPTLEVPAHLYDLAVAGCCEINAALGREPITALPAGIPGVGSQCPCGAATGVHVRHEGWESPIDKNTLIPHRMEPFTRFFDHHAPRQFAAGRAPHFLVPVLPIRVGSPS